MSELPLKYKKLIALGIDTSANLPDLNNMTDRGAKPLKPWTASKTVGTMKMIRDYSITDEETFVTKFQELSKIPLETLTKLVYSHQLNYFGSFKYNKNVIFKYTYCCVVLNSLKGNSTENKFDRWAKKSGIKLRLPKSIFDERYHVDRIQINIKNEPISFISIKPNSFSHNFIQYIDVFVGLQYLSNKHKIPWKIYYRYENFFKEISINTLTNEQQQKIESLTSNYRS